MLERGREREELAQRVPPQVVLAEQLLHVLGRRTAGARLEQAAAGEQGHDREHLGRRADLEDREEVGQVVAQHVAGDRDGVLALAETRERVPRRLVGRQDHDRHVTRVERREGLVHLADQLRVVGAVDVEPEHGRHAGRTGPGDGEAHPVHDRDVLGLRGAPDIALLDVVLDEHRAVRVEHLDDAVRRDLEGLVVAAVLLGGLSHEADVGHRADRRGVERSVRDDVLDDRLVDTGVRRVGDHRDGVLLLAVLAPQLAAVADERGHGGVDDDVRGDVQVRDALVAVDVRQARAVLEVLGDARRDGVAVGDLAEPGQDRAETVVSVEARLSELGTVGVEDVGEERAHDVAEDDGVADLHHRGLEVHRVQDVLGLRLRDRVGEERVERLRGEERRVDDLARQHLEAVLQHRDGAVGGGMADREHVVVGGDPALLVALEVVVAHRGDARLRARRERLVAVRVLLRVVLHGERRAAVAVALAQHGVDRGALDAVVARADVLLLDGRRVVGVVGDVVALRLELGDRGLQLRDGCRDVRQLDDVRLGERREPAELGERVADLLLGGEALRERGEDAAGERDVAGVDLDPRLPGEGLHDREEGGGGQGRCFVGVGVDDGGLRHVGSSSIERRGIAFHPTAQRESISMSRYFPAAAVGGMPRRAAPRSLRPRPSPSRAARASRRRAAGVPPGLRRPARGAPLRCSRLHDSRAANRPAPPPRRAVIFPTNGRCPHPQRPDNLWS